MNLLPQLLADLEAGKVSATEVYEQLTTNKMEHNDNIEDFRFREAFYFMCGYMQGMHTINPEKLFQAIYNEFGILPTYPEKFGVVRHESVKKD